MNILIAGITGFIGQKLQEALIEEGHQVSGLTRSVPPSSPHEKIRYLTWDDLQSCNDKVDLIINLAGENISGRWTHAKKHRMLTSRQAAIDRLMAFARRQEHPLRFFNAGGVGIYGLQSKGPVDEGSVIPDDPHFLPTLGRMLEAHAAQLAPEHMTLVHLRLGVVLDCSGGMLKALLPSFKLGLGAVIGEGRQPISLVSRDDVVNAIRFLIAHPSIKGAVNITLPEAISQHRFAKSLADALKRPLWLKLPSWFIKALFGEMGENLLLGGQEVLPKRLIEAGFQFQHPTLSDFLNSTSL